MRVNDRQAAFVREYLIDLNATQAAIRAGYAERGASVHASRLLRNPSVAQAIEAANRKLDKRFEVTRERVIQEIARIALSDIRRVVKWKANVVGMVEDEDGEERLAVTNQVQLIDSDDLDDDAAATVAEVSQTDKGALKIKPHDKIAALGLLAKHLGLTADAPPQVAVSVNVAVVDRPPRETREQWLERKTRERLERIGAPAGA